MEPYNLTQDIEVIFLTAPNFPNDVPHTYEKLHALITDHSNRRYFGISQPDETGVIQYKACAEILPTDDFSTIDVQKYTILKGNFAAIYIVNHFKNSDCIGDALQELLKHAHLDANGYCLEVYKNYTDLDVHCMVRIAD